MTAISMCPKCQRPVSLPEGVETAAQVRCPLCEAEFPLADAIPPELIPVDGLTLESSDWTYGIASETPKKEVKEELEDEAAAVVERISIRMPQIHKKPKSWWRTPLEIVLGALIGCLIAYYALVLWLGPEMKSKGFPVLTDLPGITWLTTPAESAE